MFGDNETKDAWPWMPRPILNTVEREKFEAWEFESKCKVCGMCGIRGMAVGLIMFRLITQAIWLKARNDRGREKSLR